MRVSVKYLTILCSVMLALGSFSTLASAQVLFSDDFEDRVQDQINIENNWTWFEHDFAGATCTGDPVGEWGPWSDSDGSDYLQENRNYWTAGQQGDSYFRAGLEVPAWEGAMTNMLRVYGNQYSAHTDCHRVWVFQEMSVAGAGDFEFSFDVAQSQYGAPENGEITGAFVKVLMSSDSSYAPLHTLTIVTTPPVATSPGDVTSASQSIEFTIPDEWVGELLQFGFYSDVTTSAGQSTWTSSALYDNVMLDKVEIVEPPIGPGGPQPEGIPIPTWALFAMAGLLAYVGGRRLRSRRRS